ncbi:MAG: hypothetical protein QOH06_4101 [Acidobacteriota bacterium]|jgi:class 3 adenylate cyclase/tetratricopeptide (TPR) repeat protein|nr:hypothetical protein [Acidobacteriota bacterium]
MKCPRCEFDNPAGMKFCGQCGAGLASPCSRCGSENPPGFKFCGECGAPLGARNPVETPEGPALSGPALRSYTPHHLSESILQNGAVLEGERKQVTVLFCDLVGSTALAERLGPETMHILLNRFFELALGEVHRYEGTINQFLGDGFMALFGAPLAHEDHARRAVLAALGLERLLEERHLEITEAHGVDLHVRMGLNTGWVVVGGIGDQLRRDYTAVGDTTNLAARLQQLAEPGTILASEATSRALQGDVQLEALPPMHVKGKEGPIQAFRVLGIGVRLSDEAVLDSASLSPFVGRRREVEVLDELREQAAGGAGQVVGIVGEAGAGKSRLLYEFRRRSGGPSAACLVGRCLSYGSGVPYLPLLYMLRNEWGIDEADDHAAVAAKVHAGLERIGLNTGELLPYLVRLLVAGSNSEELAGLSPQALQARTFTVLRKVILNAGRGGLVLLEIEDLHWVDETSEDFLAFLVEGLPAARMLLLVTHRPGYRLRWIDKSYATQINLRRLTEQESHLVVESILRRVKLPEDLVGAILAKAEGNPFFLEELTQSMMERPDVSVPDTVQGVLMARVDRLPAQHKRLLQTASVLGREFPLDLLTAVWDSPGLLGPLLSDLKLWEFLYEEPTAKEPLYFFKHALSQETVYQTLLANRRRILHASAGRAFELLYSDRLEEVYDRLAYHFSKAEDPEKAVTYLSRFAGKSALGYAHTEAAKALREALPHAERLPVEDRDRRLLELILQLAHSLLPLARFAETLELFLARREALERLGDTFLCGRYFFWLAHTYSYLGRHEEAEENAWRAIEEARQAGDGETEGRAFYVLCRDAFWMGGFSEGIEHGRQAVRLLEQAADRWWEAQAYWVLGFHHYVLGQFGDAFEAMRGAHAIWEALLDPRLDPSWSTGYFHASLGDWEQGIAECKSALARTQDPLNTAAALGFLGYAYLEKGDVSLAVEALEESVERLRQAGMQQLLGWYLAFLAEACLISGNPAEARERALEALAVTEEVRFRYGSGWAQRSLGRIARAEGELESSEAWLRRALQTFVEIRSPYEQGRTMLDLAVVVHRRGHPEEAARQLGEARSRFQELEVPRYVARSEQLASELALPLAPALS